MAQVVEAEVAGDLPALHDALNSADPAARRLAIGALDRLQALTDHAVVTMLDDPDPTVALRAIDVMARRPSGPWHRPLVDALAHADDLIVEQAAWALGEIFGHDDHTMDALIRTAAHESSICREAAIAALGAIGDKAGLPTILAGLSDRAPVRRRAVLALAPFEGPDVRAALEAALTDRDRQVRQAAEDLR